MKNIITVLMIDVALIVLGSVIGFKVSEHRFAVAIQEAGIGDCFLGHLPALPKEAIP